MLRLLKAEKYASVKTLVSAFKLTDRQRCFLSSSMSGEYIRRFILENTEIAGEHSLTPEVRLRIFTPRCRFWRERPELWPFDDPYWAIYWPGGQALSRYLLDHPGVCQGRSVLDLGSGCGASAIAAKLCGAAHVVANDIDSVAAVATLMNCELNGLEPLACVTDSIIDSEPQGFDLILLGDMFYDEVLATSLHSWLDRCIKTHGTKVLIGDPGRAQFQEHGIRHFLHQLAQYELPESVREENYGLTCSSVWYYSPELTTGENLCTFLNKCHQHSGATSKTLNLFPKLSELAIHEHVRRKHTGVRDVAAVTTCHMKCYCVKS